MRNVLALARSIPISAAVPFSSRAFCSSPYTMLQRNVLKVPVQEVQPLKVEDLVAFRPKYVKVEDVTPLREATRLYARIHIHNWNLLVTEGDLIKLPVDLKDADIGDTLVFDQVSEIGSRNYTLSGERIDPSHFSIKGVVIEKTREKRKITERTRARRRHVRHVVSNNRLTVIRVSELKIKP